MKLRTELVILFLSLTACSSSSSIADLQAGSLGIAIDGRGWVTSFSDLRSGQVYLPKGHDTPLLTVRVDGADRSPVDGEFDDGEGLMVLRYGDGLEAEVEIRTKATHITFELVALSKEGVGGNPGKGPAVPSLDLVIWGPFPTTISETIGETVGVVRGPEFAMGLQGLNPRTLGGYPWNENDAMPQLDIFESGDYSDLSEEGKRSVLYRVEAAKPDSFGSTLQAYTRERTRDRVIPNLGHEEYTAPAYADGGVVGSKIALFGCPTSAALSTVGAIEVAEGLPHPTIDGRWGKEVRSAAAAYVIMPFSESTVDAAVDVTLQAGLRYLYHPEPFRSWGHFELGPDFPHGVEGLRGAVAKAEARGVHVGVHTLSNFITTNDAYVTPLPDPRLAKVGFTRVTRTVGPADTEMEVESLEFFDQFENNHLRAAVVGDEIIRYRNTSEGEPWKLIDVERGAFGTRAGAHQAGDAIGKLADHAYRVFLTDANLTVEMATTLADLFSEAGLRQISFDGLEGNRSTGMGNYGEIIFTNTWYEALSEEIRGHFIADASRTSHYFWHIYSRMNWGEPWYAGFRESQTAYRLKNQAYFRRNMMPGMLGWFRMQPETTVEDIEWMLARSAAFDAGYAFVTSFEALEGNGRSDEILSLIGMWEEARMTGAFSADQKTRMEDIAREFHLEDVGEEGWSLREVHPVVFRYAQGVRQPGEPSHEVFPFLNPESEQPLSFVLTAEEGAVSGIRLELDGVRTVELPIHLQEGEALVYEAGDRATHYSNRWQELGTVSLDAGALLVRPGEHRLLLDAIPQGGRESRLKLEVRLSGSPEFVPSGLM